MSGIILSGNYATAGPEQIWRDPATNILMGTSGAPENSFKDVDAYPLYDLNAHAVINQKLAKKDITDPDAEHDAFLDNELRNVAQEIKANIISAPVYQKLAALRSSSNSAVNIINVWTELQGRRDRRFAAKAMAREVPVRNLLLSVDKALKFQGMVNIDEGGLAQTKQLTYSRQTFTASKYGLKFVIHEEARLKNVHNVLQDSIMIAGQKVDQRASFDTITALETNTTQAAIGIWDSFVASTARSTNSPLDDIGVAELAIEGSGVGAEMTHIGIHPISFGKYLANSYIRGLAPTTPVEYDYKPGERNLPGVDGIKLVLDNGFTQGHVHAVDAETSDANVLYLQGPQRIGSAHDEETGDDKYFIIDYHLATVAQTQTGIVITGAVSPFVW